MGKVFCLNGVGDFLGNILSTTFPASTGLFLEFSFRIPPHVLDNSEINPKKKRHRARLRDGTGLLDLAQKQQLAEGVIIAMCVPLQSRFP